MIRVTPPIQPPLPVRDVDTTVPGRSFDSLLGNAWPGGEEVRQATFGFQELGVFGRRDPLAEDVSLPLSPVEAGLQAQAEPFRDNVAGAPRVRPSNAPQHAASSQPTSLGELPVASGPRSPIGLPSTWLACFSAPCPGATHQAAAKIDIHSPDAPDRGAATADGPTPNRCAAADSASGAVIIVSDKAGRAQVAAAGFDVGQRDEEELRARVANLLDEHGLSWGEFALDGLKINRHGRT